MTPEESLLNLSNNIESLFTRIKSLEYQNSKLKSEIQQVLSESMEHKNKVKELNSARLNLQNLNEVIVFKDYTSQELKNQLEYYIQKIDELMLQLESKELSKA